MKLDLSWKKSPEGSDWMKYMTDANISGLAKELKEKGIDCETVHKLMMDHEDTRVQIKDPQIISFLLAQNKKIALITMDTELAEYCQALEIPYIRVQDLVVEQIKNSPKV